MGITYKDAGVDVDAIKESEISVGKLLQATHQDHRVVHGFGHYAGLIALPGGMLLGTHTDGVGTKVLIATLMDRYDTVGIDCMAMNGNDIVCVGATPTSFVDYIAANRNEPEIFIQIARGLAAGARQAAVPIVGGETAIMPDMFEGDGFAFDLAGTITGVVNEESLILGDRIQAGDTIVGASSSGLHSNGYTLARKVLLSKYSIHDRVGDVGRIGDALLKPTRIYVRPVLDTLKECEVHGLAHITGGSFNKLSRLKNVGFEIDSLPPTPPIMDLIAQEGIEPDEMYRTFNMGVGFCVISPRSQEGQIVDIFKRHRIDAMPIGRVTHKAGVRVKSILL